MKKMFVIVACLFLSGSLVGCSKWLVRTSTIQKPRVDQEISGNRGFIFGQASSEPQKQIFTERKLYRIELEMPELKLKKKRRVKRKSKVAAKPKEDKELWGNRGYLSTDLKTMQSEDEVKFYQPQARKIALKPAKTETTQTQLTTAKEITEPEAVEQIELEEVKPEPAGAVRSYKVKKGDTLQKISQRLYGTTKKWTLLFNANKNKLKSANDIFPGQILTIPKLN